MMHRCDELDRYVISVNRIYIKLVCCFVIEDSKIYVQ